MLNWVAREGRSRSWLKCHLLLLSCSVMSDCNPMDCSTPGFHVLHNLPEFTQINVYWVHDATWPCSLSLPSPPPSVIPSIRVFSSELTLLIGWPKVWSFSFSISPSNNYLGLISFRIDWFDLLAVQGTLKRVFSSITIWKHQLFGVLPSLKSNSYPYMTTGKTIWQKTLKCSWSRPTHRFWFTQSQWISKG